MKCKQSLEPEFVFSEWQTKDSDQVRPGCLPLAGILISMMTAELSPVDSTPLTSVADENIGIENGVLKSNGVLTVLDRVSPTFYKRDMPSAFGLVDQNGNTTNGIEVVFSHFFYHWFSCFIFNIYLYFISRAIFITIQMVMVLTFNNIFIWEDRIYWGLC